MSATAFWTLIGYGSAVVVTVALTWIMMGRRHPSFRMALMVAGLWVLANLTDAWMDPWMDAVGFYAALLTWWGAEFDSPRPIGRMRRVGGNRWVLALAVVFLAQQVVHFVIHDPASFARQAALNVLFVVALMVIGFPSVSRAIQPFGPRRRHRDDARRAPVMARSDKG